MPSPVSLVDNLRPASRDQVKLKDRILRATNTTAEQTARGNSTVLQWDMSGYASFAVTFSGDSQQFGIDGSNDLVSWFPVDGQIIGVNNAPVSFMNFYLENSALVGVISTTTMAGNKQARFMRVRCSTSAGTRNVAVTAALSQTPFMPTRPTKHLGPDNAWNYVAPVGGITTNAAVTLRAAPNLYHRSLIAQMQLDNGGATATEAIITESIGSAVLWRGWLPSGAGRHFTFDPPLRGTVNGALTLTLSAASGAAVYANVQGLTALA